MLPPAEHCFEVTREVLVQLQFHASNFHMPSCLFVELFNADVTSVDISGWKLKRHDLFTIATILTVTGGTTLQPGQHFLAGALGYSNTLSPDQCFTTTLANWGGVALYLPGAVIRVDTAGTVTDTIYREGHWTGPMTTLVDRSWERKAGGGAGSCTDSNINGDDFQVTAPSQPQNLASALTPCPSAPVTKLTVINYTYDPVQRLSGANYSGAYTYAFGYAYDAVGNRTTQTRTLTSTQVIAYRYDNANRLTNAGGQAYTWDNNGNLLNDGTSVSAYDPANRLKTLTQTATVYSFAYNGVGDRLKQIIAGTLTTYTMDLNAGPTQVLADGSSTYLFGTVCPMIGGLL